MNIFALLLSVLLLNTYPAHAQTLSQGDRMTLYKHSEVERRYTPWYVFKAKGQLNRKNFRSQQHPWPVKVLSIGHTMASYQKYAIRSPYFHHGIDIRAEAGSDVLAAAGGKVVNIENYVKGDPAYWEVAILDQQGFLWQYHHVDKRSIPQNIWKAFKEGTSIPAGTKIGEVYFWTVKSFGEYFHHIHLNVLGAEGVYLNPFNFLKPLPDRVAPRITKVGLWTTKGEQRSDSISSGTNYTIYATVEDLILHSKFKVPPYSISASINGGAKFKVWQFDSLPGGKSKTDYIHNFFIQKYTCGNYRCRNFSINLGFYRGRQLQFPSQPGRHYIDLEARDFAGNRTQQRYEWTIN